MMSSSMNQIDKLKQFGIRCEFVTWTYTISKRDSIPNDGISP